jgi:hypothetical protein
VRFDGTAPPPALAGLRVMLQPVKATVMTISAGRRRLAPTAVSI